MQWIFRQLSKGQLQKEIKQCLELIRSHSKGNFPSNLENHSLLNTKQASEPCSQLVNFQENQKTMVLIINMRCLAEKPCFAQKYVKNGSHIKLHNKENKSSCQMCQITKSIVFYISHSLCFVAIFDF